MMKMTITIIISSSSSSRNNSTMECITIRYKKLRLT